MGGMDMKEMDMGKDKKSESKTHRGAGTVKKVDPASGKVTIAHGPIPTMKWPAINMTFTIKDKALLAKFSQDKKVEFEFVQQGSDYVITSAKWGTQFVTSPSQVLAARDINGPACGR